LLIPKSSLQPIGGDRPYNSAYDNSEFRTQDAAILVDAPELVAALRIKFVLDCALKTLIIGVARSGGGYLCADYERTEG
jgi:hypothetical protein